MQKLLAVAIVWGFFGLATAVFSQNVGLSGMWTKTYDFQVDGTLSGKIISNDIVMVNTGENKFAGQYVGKESKNTSVFTIQVFNQRKTLVIIDQVDSAYRSVIAGILNGNMITGTWYDSLGNAGDIVMTHADGNVAKPTPTPIAQVPATPAPATPAPDPYPVGTAVEVSWVGEWYPATILKIEDGRYFIHYTDYADSWNEWVDRERIRSVGK